MPRKKTSIDERDWAINFADGGIEKMPLDAELMKSMQSYIDYTLVERALPYIDGCKPVVKAILWAAWNLNLKPSSNYLKAATLASTTIGHYHAHSDAAVYDAMTGITRENGDDTRGSGLPISLCLLDGKGGWADTAPQAEAAAARYTECKLSETGASCIQDTKMGAVYMSPTFDGKHVMPQLLPTRLPLLLINGAAGLAYGYNVKWLPHNPSEAIQACIYRIDNPKCTINDIQKIMPGPDFPSGGICIDREEDGIKTAYETGFGNVSLCARYEIKQEKQGKHTINIYQAPFKVPHITPEKKKKDKKSSSIVSSVMDFAIANPQYGIIDVKALADRGQECDIEITIKKGIDPNAVACAIMQENSQTRLNETISYRQSLVLGDFIKAEEADANGIDGVLKLINPIPSDVGILEYIDAFIEFRIACITNASNYERDKAEAQKHLIDGMLIALMDIDEVIAIVRKSQNKDTAKKNLKKHFKIDEVQADYILAIPLSRLTRSDKIQLEGNSKNLAQRIKELNKLLSSRKNLIKEVRNQLEEELQKQVLTRRTTIVNHKGKIIAKAASDKGVQLEETKKIISMVLNRDNNALKMPNKDNSDANMADDLSITGETDVILNADGELSSDEKKTKTPIFKLTDIDMQDDVLIIYADGSSTRIKGFEIPSTPSMIGQKAVGISQYDEKNPVNVAMLSSDGKVKVLDVNTLTKNPDCDVMKLSTGAEILAARPISGNEQVFVFITSNANLLKFPVSSVPVQGRTSAGVAGIKLVKDAKVIAGLIANENDIVVTNTGKTIKATPLAEYPPKGRGSQGVRCHKFLSGENNLIGAYVGNTPKRIDKKVALPEFSKRDASGTKQDGLSKARFSE